MIAIGKNINGEEIEFSISNIGNNSIFCSNNQLSELHLPNDVKNVNCANNNLTELDLPDSVKEVYCYNNNLKEINLPNGVEIVNCVNNPIKQITLPKNIEKAWLPKGCEILNLDSKNFQERNLKIYFQ